MINNSSFSWRLSNLEWATLEPLLTSSDEIPLIRGRPRTVDDREIAEAALYMLMHSKAPKYSCKGYHHLKGRVSATTLSVRIQEWEESGVWVQFWDRLLELRRSHPLKERRRRSLIRSQLMELETLHGFFNARFFGNVLSPAIITIERSLRRAGIFSRARQTRKEIVDLIALSMSATKSGLSTVAHILLHEMAHQWNATFGIRDCSGRGRAYHNDHFRSAAELGGLTCQWDKRSGFARTDLGQRANAALCDFKGNARLFTSAANEDPATP